MGPLQGIRIVEFAALGPAPMGTMLLADLGAEVLRIERKTGAGSRPTAELFDPAIDILNRNRRVVALDLKQAEAIATVLRLVEGADAVIEGFRPGVMERLGLGPEVCLQHNPRLVYARMTGWGQHGKLAQAAGHDINYLSLSGGCTRSASLVASRWSPSTWSPTAAVRCCSRSACSPACWRRAALAKAR